VWLALAQGSSELIWWPYLIAKYGLAFLFLLVPACLLQLPVNYHIGAYTVLTGESIFQGFRRLSPWFAGFLYVFMAVSFFWFGAFASAGGTSLAALTGFPAGWSDRGRMLFWAYSSIAVFFIALLLSRVVYRVIELFMWCVATATLAGLFLACLHPDVLEALPAFCRGIVVPDLPPPRPWDPGDADTLLTAIAFAGLGGFWALFYSYWLREKGAGMAAYAGRVTGPVTGREEVISVEGWTFPDTGEDVARMARWKRHILVDSGIGIAGNIATTLMTCLLAYALLHPRGILPEGHEIAVVQARFFEASWGPAGRVAFLVIAACFLSDAWMATLDAVSRIHADFLIGVSDRARRIGYRKVYYGAALAMTAITSVTVLWDTPGALIKLSAVIGFGGTVVYTFALLLLSSRTLPAIVPPRAAPGRAACFGLLVAWIAYLAMAIAYGWTLFHG